MAVNFLKELDIDDVVEDDTTECPKDETSTASLLHFKYPEEENNNMINMKNNNDDGNENDKGDGGNSSGLSSLLSKFSLTKLRSQKWAKPISRLSLPLGANFMANFGQKSIASDIDIFRTFIYFTYLGFPNIYHPVHLSGFSK